MADYNPQVALGINAPDPQGGLKSISGILGIGEQGLAIKQKQLQNQSLQAAAIQNTQDAKERMNLVNLMQDPVASGMVDSEGNERPGAKLKMQQAAPSNWSKYYSDWMDAATKKVQFNGAVNDLRTSERTELANTAGGVATRAQSPDDITTALDNLVESKKGTPEYGNYQTIAGTMKTAINHLATKTAGNNPSAPGQEPWRQGALKMVSSILPASSTVGPSGLATPTAAAMPTTTGTQPGTVAPPLQGAGFTPQGPVITAPPTITPTPAGLVRVPAGGGSANIIPSAPAPGAAPGAPSANANPSQAEAAAKLTQATAVGERVAQAQAQAANTVQAQDALTRAKAILESGQAPDTGAGFDTKKAIVNYLASGGITTSTADNMNTLTKNLARYEASRATAAGLGATDAARLLSHNGSPNTQIDNKALLGIVRQSLATEKVLSMYANVQSKTNDPQRQLQNEVALRNIPHPIETTEYMMSRNKAEAEAYLKQHGISHEDITKSAAALQQFGNQ